MGDSIKRARHFFLIVRMETQKIAYLRITAGQRSVPDFEDHVILRHLAAADNLQKQCTATEWQAVKFRNSRHYSEISVICKRESLWFWSKICVSWAKHMIWSKRTSQIRLFHLMKRISFWTEISIQKYRYYWMEINKTHLTVEIKIEVRRNFFNGFGHGLRLPLQKWFCPLL